MIGLLPLGLVLGAVAIFSIARADSDEQLLVIGTAPVSGVYYPAGGAICRLVNTTRDVSGFRCVVESTDGSAENLQRLRDGDLDFAFLQSDWQYHAFQGSGGPGIEQPYSDLRALFSLHAQPLTIVASRESGIENVSQLRGKRVNLGPTGSAVRSATEMLIQSLGWTDQDFAEITNLGVNEQVQALCAGLIDAFILPTSHPNGVVAAATEGCLGKLVTVDGEAVNELIDDWPFYAVADITGGLYRGNPISVRSFGVRATLVTRADMPLEIVYHMVRTVFERLDELKQQHPALKLLNREEMAGAGITAPLHQGALVYYEGLGLN